jgi:hypothetical protein
MLVPKQLEEIQYCIQLPLFEYHQFQGKTNNCGPTSLAIAANAFLGEKRYEGIQIAQELNNWWYLFPKLIFPRIYNWMTFPWGITQYLKKSNIPARWVAKSNKTKLLKNLQNNQITIVVIGEVFRWQGLKYTGWGHIKVLYGYRPDRGFLFVDPAYPKNEKDADPWKRVGLHWQNEVEFLRQWKNLLNICIEVG